MHGLINKSIQSFLRDTYGQDLWDEIAVCVEVDSDGFEAMLLYEDTITHAVLSQASTKLDKPIDVLLEDLGTYLVSHPNLERLRRLLRFGGATFADFLHSFDEMPERAKMAVPNLDLPSIDLIPVEAGAFKLICDGNTPGFGHVLVGLLRAMADDYGVLAFLEHSGTESGREEIAIHLLDSGFAAGREFDLAAEVAS